MQSSKIFVTGSFSSKVGIDAVHLPEYIQPERLGIAGLDELRLVQCIARMIFPGKAEQQKVLLKELVPLTAVREIIGRRMSVSANGFYAPSRDLSTLVAYNNGISLNGVPRGLAVVSFNGRADAPAAILVEYGQVADVLTNGAHGTGTTPAMAERSISPITVLCDRGVLIDVSRIMSKGTYLE